MRRWKSAWTLLLLVSCSAAPPTEIPLELTAEVGVDDVSFLYPLELPLAQRTSLLGAASTGAKGPLLPKDLFGALPPLDILTPNAENYSLLRVVSVRIDPCFPGLGVKSEDACKNQIRLVMQPVLPKPGVGLTSADVAVHLFYSLTRPELSGVLRQIVELREASSIPRSLGPVGIHPALGRDGAEGPFAKGLRALLLDHAGKDNLTRVTFMGIEQVGQKWRFGGFDVEGAAMRPISIPLVTVKEQVFQNRDLDGVTFVGAGAEPPSPGPDAIGLLLDPRALAAASADERLVAYKAALRIENPKLYSPDTIDCATCHATPAARTFAERTYGPFPAALSERYAPPQGLSSSGATAQATNELRAFGYFGDRPSVSARTVNETAEVVEHVNKVVRKGP